MATKNKKPEHGFTIGDILVSSWGYDQTNVDFYQVTRIMPKTIEIRAIRKHCEETGFMCGYSVPIPSAFRSGCTKHLVKKREKDEFIKLSSFEFAYKWDGKPKYTSWYA